MKPGYKTTELYATGAAGTALLAAINAALEAGQQWSVVGCALALAVVTHGYASSRARAKGGAQ